MSMLIERTDYKQNTVGLNKKYLIFIKIDKNRFKDNISHYKK